MCSTLLRAAMDLYLILVSLWIIFVQCRRLAVITKDGSHGWDYVCMFWYPHVKWEIKDGSANCVSWRTTNDQYCRTPFHDIQEVAWKLWITRHSIKSRLKGNSCDVNYIRENTRIPIALCKDKHRVFTYFCYFTVSRLL